MGGKPTGKFLFLWISLILLLFAISYQFIFVKSKNTPKQNAKLVSAKLAKEIKSIEPLLLDIKSEIERTGNPTFRLLLRESEYPYFIFANRRVYFWSNNVFTPKYRDVLGDFTLSYVETSKGKYIVRKAQFSHELKLFEVVFLIPLTETSTVVNEYLKNTYNENLFTDSNIEIEKQATDEEFRVIEVDGEKLFAVKFGSTYSNSDFATKTITIILLILTLLSIIIFIKSRLDEYVKEGNISLGFLFLLSCILILRSVMLLTGFPLSFVYIDLFDPIHYGSSLVNPSLGDLLLNLISLCLLGLYLFNHFVKSKIVKRALLGSHRRQLIIAIICIFFTFFWLAVHHQIMKTLNNDSQWSMDISQSLDFDYLKVIGYIIFFISVVIYFLFAHVCFRLFIQLVKNDLKKAAFSIILGLALFLGFALLLRWDFGIVILVNLAFILIINFFKLPKFVGKIQYLTFIYFFSFGLPGAVIGLYANYQFTRSNMDYNKSRLANQLLLESDFYTEFQLADIGQKIKDDFWVKDRIVDPFASKLLIEKHIRREYLSSLDNFDIKIFGFNSRGQPYEEFNLKDNYHDFKSRLAEFKTDTEGLYFINQAAGQRSTRYLDFLEIEDRGQVTGYVLLDLTQKRPVPNSVFPLLLSESMYAQQIEGAEKFSYSIFNNEELQYNFGGFNYRQSLNQFSEKSDLIFEKSVLINGYYHKAFSGEGDKVVIISALQPSLGARFANFSFLFLIYIFAILLFLISTTLFQSVRKVKLNYATKIQLYLNFAFFTPLLIISITTVSIIVQTFKTSLEHQYLEYAHNLSTQMSGPLNDYRKTDIYPGDLIDITLETAEIADLDINLFTNGRLVASSLNQVYQNEILSSNIEPRAYIQIVEEKETSFIQQEHVGLLTYKNVYVAVRSYDTGAIIGILSLPFFASQRDLEDNIVEVLSNIINIFTFVFIIFLFVSFFVSRGLTFPLQLITQKIRRTSLSSYNEPISWNSDDEIGLMVTEYNRMLVNLEESKIALAKSEKESAWREMARQVAHEIKNPLTPMKLTLQHMKRVIEDDGAEGEQQEKKMNQISNLLEQIETLSDIATSFSDFAKMPAPVTEHLDLGKLLKETIDLYNKKELGKIVTNIAPGNFMINGDRKWLGRAFSNLIINGFQAVDEKKGAKIEVSLLAGAHSSIRVEIKDNGHGIPEHIQDKVFTPNFSTKYTGSGLGLAITKKGIEHANGNIWFESEENVGTTFYIDIPRG